MADKQMKRETTTMRVFEDHKERVKKIVRRLADKEQREVTELEIGEILFSESLPKLEQKLGI